MSRQPAGSIVDVGVPVADIAQYWFLGVAGAVTVTGILLDVNGKRANIITGTVTYTPAPAFSAVIPAASAGVTDGVNLATIMGLTGTLPANYPDAGGVIINLSGDVYVDIQGAVAASSDFKTNPTRYPILSAGNGIKLSRVN